MGKNESFDENRDLSQVLYIKLHLKMPGNINFSMFWSIVGRSVPPLLSHLQSLQALKGFNLIVNIVGLPLVPVGEGPGVSI